jgi:hypothetical protein
MGIGCLTECVACHRHVRCGERACPFCGQAQASRLRVLQYRLLNRLDRSRAFSLGAALATVGIASACESQGAAIYGAPCNPPECVIPGGGGSAGGSNSAAASGGEGGEAGEGGNESD